MVQWLEQACYSPPAVPVLIPQALQGCGFQSYTTFLAFGALSQCLTYSAGLRYLEEHSLRPFRLTFSLLHTLLSIYLSQVDWCGFPGQKKSEFFTTSPHVPAGTTWTNYTWLQAKSCRDGTYKGCISLLLNEGRRQKSTALTPLRSDVLSTHFVVFCGGYQLVGS